ncbi:MAG: hypothetical protein [Cressdnaviricota sp.]|nr:MAG: hypothetical protein [Cressdnaviricota sp.]
MRSSKATSLVIPTSKSASMSSSRKMEVPQAPSQSTSSSLSTISLSLTNQKSLTSPKSPEGAPLFGSPLSPVGAPLLQIGFYRL